MTTTTPTALRPSRVVSHRLLGASLLVPLCGTTACLFDPPQPEMLVEEAFTEDCVPQAWLTAQDDDGVGVPTTFELQGGDPRVDGGMPVVETIAAPMAFQTDHGESWVLVFDDATVEDNEQGTLVVVGARIEADQGTLEHGRTAELAIGSDAVTVWPSAAADDGWRPSLGQSLPNWFDDALESSPPLGLVAEDLRITGYDHAYLVTPAETWALQGSFRVSAREIYWNMGSWIEAEAVTGRWDGELTVGIDAWQGELRTDEGVSPSLPLVVLGRDAHLELSAHSVRTVEPMPVVQALGDEGVLLGSSIELRACEPETIVMGEGETRALRFAYRQPGGTAEAVVASAQIVDPTTEVVWSEVEIDPTLPMDLVVLGDTYAGTSWGGRLENALGVIIEIGTGLGQAIGCVITLFLACSEDAPEAEPFPMWMEAGAVGELETMITAPWEPGTHALELRIAGTNYEEQVVPLTLVVQ